MNHYLEAMKQFLSFRSISTDPQYKPEMEKTAAFLVHMLKNNWFNAQAITGYSNPIVYWHYVVDATLPTYLVYWHYDVQPADKEEWREYDPFNLLIKDNKLIARGAVDNKGQIMIHIVTIIDLIKKGQLKYNIKFMIEGDEETGSPYLEKFMDDYKELLACDVVVVSDGEIIGDHTPTIWASFRGGCNMTLTLKTADVDLHSGLFGGIAPNSAYESSKLLAKLYNEKNEIAIPGYYANVTPVSKAVRENNKNLPLDENEIKASTGIKSILVQEGYDMGTANWLMPTIQISSIQSGYTGNGYRNAIPHSTTIKINFRYAPWQNPEEMIKLFGKRVWEELPSYVSYSIETSDPYPAILLDIDHAEVKRAADILTQIYGKKAVYRYCWAAIPVTWLFKDILWAWVVIADLANEDCHMHGVDENFRLSCVEKGLEFSKLFFSN